VLRAHSNNLAARVVEDDHPVVLCSDLLEEHVVDLQAVGYGIIWLASFEDGLATDLLDVHLPLAAYGGLDNHLPRHQA
jgi:hypothetical protein